MSSPRKVPRGQRRSPRLRAPAYLMPLAAGAAGLLLLFSLSLQGLAVGERLQVNTLERVRREEDVLVSAAHQLLAALNGPHRCLLALPLARWPAEGSACASPEALAMLYRVEVWSVPVRLLRWEPGAGGRTAELELELESEEARPPRRGRFQTRLAEDPPRAVDLRGRDLAGALP